MEAKQCKVLTREEVEELLNDMVDVSRPLANEKRIATARDKPFTRIMRFLQKWWGREQAISKERIVPIDWSCSSPHRLEKEQIKMLDMMHQFFCLKFAAILSAMIRTESQVKLTVIDELSYSELLSGLDNPTCFNLLRAKPLEENLILDINPSILYPILDRLLGDRGKPETITNTFLQELKHAWENIIDLDFEVIQTESDPTLIQTIPSNEGLVIFVFEVKVALLGACGYITFCIPYSVFERIANKLIFIRTKGY